MPARHRPGALEPKSGRSSQDRQPQRYRARASRQRGQARFTQAGHGAIVNIGSVIGLAPEYGSTVYGATKAFILFLSQSLHTELGPKGVYVQAVLPAAVRTEIWQHAGKDVDKLPAVMEVDELVDAALAGFDRRETVTIPPLPDAAQWTDFEAARKVMFPNFSQVHAAARYHLAA